MKKIITDGSTIDEIDIKHADFQFIGFEMGNADRFIITKRPVNVYSMNKTSSFIATSLKYLNTGYCIYCESMEEYIKSLVEAHPSLKFYQCDSIEELIAFGLRKKETYEVHERLLTRDMALYRKEKGIE